MYFASSRLAAPARTPPRPSHATTVRRRLANSRAASPAITATITDPQASIVNCSPVVRMEPAVSRF
ncbi:MAG: hypothetical protein QM809_06375 [Gordonia sp. (in: high G+C Gram-positive bacteria)]|uniref:hypothetical protein n=1 Tax=Gordonia sp. (in: high G+C Gram-positive bacteria) TaxID=84139 RepID=UPI0039E42A0E